MLTLAILLLLQKYIFLYRCQHKIYFIQLYVIYSAVI